MIRRTLYVAPDTPPEARTEFRREAAARGVEFLGEFENFFLAPEDGPNLVWACDISWDAYEVAIPSIAGGAKNLMDTLRAVRNRRPAEPSKALRWLLLDGEHHRRAALISENLASAETTDLGPPDFSAAPSAGFFLIAPDRGVAVFDSLGPYPGGAIPLEERRVGPPSRAYLKLWEAFARLRTHPRPGEATVDLGSCPGGWSWALAEMKTEVLSIDGAPLDPTVAARPEIIFRKGDAFRISPADALAAFATPRRKIDWLFSDMICEPRRLPELISRWLESGFCERFVISVKFKGEADTDAIARLAAIPGGRLRHLRQNKHELTWFRTPELTRI